MEFFCANELWSGVLVIYTNVICLPNNLKSVPDNDESYLANIWLDAEDSKKVRQHLKKCGHMIEEDRISYERALEREFYCGTPVDSWFLLQKFLSVCDAIQINPKIFYYDYKQIKL